MYIIYYYTRLSKFNFKFKDLMMDFKIWLLLVLFDSMAPVAIDEVS
jgi:hypothetical protein